MRLQAEENHGDRIIFEWREQAEPVLTLMEHGSYRFVSF